MPLATQPPSQGASPPPPPPARAPVPAASSPAPAAAAPGVTVVAPPADIEQLRDLRARERAVREQLEQATEERDDLAESLQPGESGPAPGPEVTSGVTARIAVIDERILRLERERDGIDRAIAGAPPGLLGNERSEVATTAAIDNVREEGVGMGLSGGVPLGMLLMLGILAIRRRLAAGRAPRPLPETGRSQEQLVAAVEAMAVEVERIGEAQRFMTQLLVERGEVPAAPSRTRQPAG